MKLETFFEKFEQFADTPNAVTKMRELLLQLAMQGKLVEQSCDDGAATELLAAIYRERAACAQSVRTPAEQPLANGDNHSFQIPSNWAWTKLGNVALQIQYGYTASADPSFTEIRMLRITDIQNNRVDWSSVPGCQIEQTEAEKYLLSSNDILIARTGGTIGKSFIVPETPVKSVFASYLIRVTPPRSIAAQYLKIFIESPLYWTQLREMSAGTGQPNVNGQALGRLEFPLPPLAEQKRIVAKVDELMALCDRLEAQQQERDIRHTALTRASLARFADAPTPANLNFLFHPYYAITSADLRRIILKVAFDGSLTGAMPIADLLPNGWVLRDIASMCTIEDGDRGSNYPNKNDFSDSGYCVFLNTKNVRPDGFNFASIEWISKEKHNDLRKGTLIRGDVVFTSRGTIGNVAHYDQDVPFNVMRINSGMFILRGFQNHMDPAFLSLLLRSPQIRKQIEDLRSGSAQPQLPIREFKKFTAKIPPLAEQRRIVAKVDQLMALVDQLEAQLTASRTTAINLMEAVVAELTLQGVKHADT